MRGPDTRPSLVLVELPGGVLHGHGGSRPYRRHELWLNGVRIDVFWEFMASSDYESGSHYDEQVRARVYTFERALGVRAMRARSRR